MSEQARRISRRQALQLSLGGVLAGGGLLAARGRPSGGGGIQTVSPAGPGAVLQQAGPIVQKVRMIATDGFMSYPGRRVRQPLVNFDGTEGYGYDADRIDGGDGVYSFGFRGVDPDDIGGQDPYEAEIGDLVGPYKGLVTNPSPIVGFAKDAQVFLKLSNLGFELRPDLDDAHTLHWHGFRQAVAVFDGVPEVSISVPPIRDFPYYYEPKDEGTYMYHCHFEDTEHVQMGMDGIVYVDPAASPPAGFIGQLYEDPATAYHRHFTLLLNEVDVNPHDQLVAVQEFTWSDYDPHYFVINGRSYPDTVRGPGDPGITTNPWYDGGDTLPLQPVTSLVQANAGEQVAIRLANLGYQSHEMQLAGIPMTVYGKDATRLQGPSGDLAYETNNLDCAPGESRDAVFTAPAHSGNPGPDVYYFKNRNVDRLVNGPTGPLSNGLGGMVTEVHVHPAGTLPTQTLPNEIFQVAP